MPVSHISFDSNSEYGQQLRSSLNSLEKGKDDLNDLLGVMATMLDGDGSQAAHFEYFIPRFGFPDTATAKAAYDELQSLMFKLNTDAQVDFVNAAMTQVFNKFG